MPVLRECSVCHGPLADNDTSLVKYRICGVVRFAERMHRDCHLSLDGKDMWDDEPEEKWDWLEEANA